MIYKAIAFLERTGKENMANAIRAVVRENAELKPLVNVGKYKRSKKWKILNVKPDNNG